jgi:pyrroline-5-carboxylate reductase
MNVKKTGRHLMNLNKTVAFIGAGSMAEAMIAGIVNKNTLAPERVIVTNRSNEQRREELLSKYGVSVTKSVEFAVQEANAIILAMKPKDAEQALAGIKDLLRPDQVVLSVLAGVSTSFMEENLNEGQPVVRVMPNTSSMIGESITAISTGKHASIEDVLFAKELLESIGKVVTINEDQMDVFTGVAGSGPAYFYYLIEHLEQAAIEGGLDETIARDVAVQTVFGASKMVMETKESPSILREKVTSPNGTTAAGLKALAEFGGGRAVKEAVRNAAKRSNEICESFEKTPVKA